VTIARHERAASVRSDAVIAKATATSAAMTAYPTAPPPMSFDTLTSRFTEKGAAAPIATGCQAQTLKTTNVTRELALEITARHSSHSACGIPRFSSPGHGASNHGAETVPGRLEYGV